MNLLKFIQVHCELDFGQRARTPYSTGPTPMHMAPLTKTTARSQGEIPPEQTPSPVLALSHMREVQLPWWVCRWYTGLPHKSAMVLDGMGLLRMSNMRERNAPTTGINRYIHEIYLDLDHTERGVQGSFPGAGSGSQETPRGLRTTMINIKYPALPIDYLCTRTWCN